MVRIFMSRGNLAAGVVILALLAGAGGLADRTVSNCRTAATVPTSDTVEHIRKRARSTHAYRASAPTIAGVSQPRKRNGLVAVAYQPSTTGDIHPRKRSRHSTVSAASSSMPARANASCA